MELDQADDHAEEAVPGMSPVVGPRSQPAERTGGRRGGKARVGREGHGGQVEVMVEEESAGAPFEEAETRARRRAAARAAAALPMVAATLIAAP